MYTYFMENPSFAEHNTDQAIKWAICVYIIQLSGKY